MNFSGVNIIRKPSYICAESKQKIKIVGSRVSHKKVKSRTSYVRIFVLRPNIFDQLYFTLFNSLYYCFTKDSFHLNCSKAQLKFKNTSILGIHIGIFLFWKEGIMYREGPNLTLKCSCPHKCFLTHYDLSCFLCTFLLEIIMGLGLCYSNFLQQSLFSIKSNDKHLTLSIQF